MAHDETGKMIQSVNIYQWVHHSKISKNGLNQCLVSQTHNLDNKDFISWCISPSNEPLAHLQVDYSPATFSGVPVKNYNSLHFL
jgi:hypothetical protein